MLNCNGFDINRSDICLGKQNFALDASVNSNCNSFPVVTIRSDFSRNDESWKASDGEENCSHDQNCLSVGFDAVYKYIKLKSEAVGSTAAYFLAPGMSKIMAYTASFHIRRK